MEKRERRKNYPESITGAWKKTAQKVSLPGWLRGGGGRWGENEPLTADDGKSISRKKEISYVRKMKKIGNRGTGVAKNSNPQYDCKKKNLAYPQKRSEVK